MQVLGAGFSTSAFYHVVCCVLQVSLWVDFAGQTTTRPFGV